ncbi:hypothetical protein J3T99_05715 [Acetobacteraceae bacterium B3987]|nr:hypothetical protein [Acetobacteraceae bacterium B3987]
MATELTAPAYPYQQFSDDADIVALFDAYNRMAQGTLTWMNDHILPLYMRSSITGGLLDYAAYCLYGQRRYRIGYVDLVDASGAIDTALINALAIDGTDTFVSTGGTFVSDDIFKRALTWNYHKGDGCQFSIPWLKKRVMRFLTGEQGHAWRFNGTLPVSITVSGQTVTITVTAGLADSTFINALPVLIQRGVLSVPASHSYSVKEGN